MSVATVNKRVMLALSGGVDSSAAACMLRQQGYTVEAVTMVMSDAHHDTTHQAGAVADSLGLKLHILDLRERFQKQVIEPFAKAYYDGATPNPCVICNPRVKFNALLASATENGCDRIATGHYAHIGCDSGVYYIAQGACQQRDQSYMLYRLGQDVLSRLLLPLADFEKDAVRQLADSFSLASAKQPDSQEICFIPDNDYPAYLESRFGKSKQGRFIAPDGSMLGWHKGVVHYTVGQRRGLGVALGEPVFVRRIDAHSGDIFLAYAGQLADEGIIAGNCIFSDPQFKRTSFSAGVKIRSMARCVPARIEFIDDQTVRVLFEEPQRAPAKGQSAVFYQAGRVVGGGFIQSSF